LTRQECQQLVDSYLDWLRTGLAVEEVNGYCELTTPFLDRHNDHLQIYAQKQDGKIVLTDDGYILSDLRTSGLDISTPKRKDVLDSLLNGFGVRLNDNQLVSEASPKTLGQKVHSLLQAMLAVNDMFVLSQPRVASFFWEDVKEFLEKNDVRFSPRIKLTGKSGFDHNIDFLIPKSKTQAERLVQAINAPTKNTIGSYLWLLSDSRDARGKDSIAYAFLNDQDHRVGAEVVDALQAYGVVPALWSNREQYVHQLQ
jgi:hypothetical protein